MGTLEIVLLVAGGLILLGSFFLPFQNDEKNLDNRKLIEREVKEAIDRQIADTKGKIEDIVDETVNYAVDKTERSLERVSNEKIMAVNEYSDTVLAEINKNHNEVMFLYDMLNDKHKNLTTTVSKVEKTVKEAEASVKATVNAGESTNIGGTKEISADTATEEISAVKNNKEVAKQPQVKEFSFPKYNEKSGENEKEDSAQDEFVLLSPQNVASKKVIKSKAPQKNQVEANLDISFMKDTKKNGNNNERILDLHNQGKSNVAIAKELGLGVGEVKLVIDLFEGL